MEKRFAEAIRGDISQHSKDAHELAKKIVYKQLDAAEALNGDQYITITAASSEGKLGYPELKMAIRLLPGFVDE